MDEIRPGLVGRSILTVTGDDTAKAMGSGELPVFATPALVALMENAAVNALADHLPEGATTVGAHITVDHIAPTPVGMAVSATATLVETSGNHFTFDITASDEKGEIGRAWHRRVAVQTERFMKKVSEKQQGE
ncbi:MAG: thioesterase family protein [Christensenellales bacterium]|jgi:fluoroacetyl-CoA thioesterase